jgi:fatty acid desaturase
MPASPSKACNVRWYRTPLTPDVMQDLHARSDRLGLLQTLAYLGILVATGTAAYLAPGRLPWPAVVALVFLHGTVFAFQINAVHELGHRTVFRSNGLNDFFVRIFAFLGWIHYDLFYTSHARHHRYTLHPPDDLEVVLPLHFLLKDLFKHGIVNIKGPYHYLRDAIRIARGRFRGEWELALFPESEPEKRWPIMRWARLMLAGHVLLVGVSIAFGWWMLPVVVTLAPFYGGWLHLLCNSTQHIGLRDNVPDFRLCCRTIKLNPLLSVLYWHMQYHIEHHMYPAVPCYRLGALRRAIDHDLPPRPNGLVAAWREILAIQRRQRVEPGFQYQAPLPTPGASS